MKLKHLIILFALILALVASGCKVVDLPEQSADPDSSQEDSIPEESGDPESQPEPAPDRTELPEEPLSTLAENVVYSTDYLYYYNAYRNQMISMYGSYMDMSTFWEQEIDGQTVQQYLTDETLKMVREQAVFYRTATQEGIELASEEKESIDGEIKSVLDSQFEGSDQKFLNAFSLTPAQMKDVLQRSALVAQYVNQAMEKVTVTDPEITEYYQANKDSLDQVTVRHILIDATDEMTEEEQAAAKTKAEDILAQVQGGADIGALAAEHSTDPGSKDNNGEYTFGKGQMVAEFEEWAFAAKPGDQGMVKTSYGYHIMQKMSQSGLEEVKEQVTQTLRQEKFPKQYSNLYDLVDSPDWTMNQELLDQIIASAAV